MKRMGLSVPERVQPVATRDDLASLLESLDEKWGSYPVFTDREAWRRQGVSAYREVVGRINHIERIDLKTLAVYHTLFSTKVRTLLGELAHFSNRLITAFLEWEETNEGDVAGEANVRLTEKGKAYVQQLRTKASSNSIDFVVLWRELLATRSVFQSSVKKIVEILNELCREAVAGPMNDDPNTTTKVVLERLAHYIYEHSAMPTVELLRMRVHDENGWSLAQVDDAIASLEETGMIFVFGSSLTGQCRLTPMGLQQSSYGGRSRKIANELATALAKFHRKDPRSRQYNISELMENGFDADHDPKLVLLVVPTYELTLSSNVKLVDDRIEGYWSKPAIDVMEMIYQAFLNRTDIYDVAVEVARVTTARNNELLNQNLHRQRRVVVSNRNHVFVSHSSDNREIVGHFVQLILQLGIEIPAPQIFYSSSVDSRQRPRMGTYFMPEIRRKASESAVLVALISKEFYESPMCMCEIGAAWALLPDGFIPVLVGTDYSNLKAILEGMQVMKLRGKDELNDIKDRLCEILQIDQPPSAVWERNRDAFLVKWDEWVKKTTLSA